MEYKKYIFESITCLISIFALLVAVKSCNISQNAQKISENQFIELNRPYLKLKVAKINDTKDFFKLEKTGNGVRIIIKIKIENIGKLPAKDIRLPKKVKAKIPLGGYRGIILFLCLSLCLSLITVIICVITTVIFSLVSPSL